MAEPAVPRHGMAGQGSMALAMYGAIAAGLALAIGADAKLGIVALLAAVVIEMLVFFVAHATSTSSGRRTTIRSTDSVSASPTAPSTPRSSCWAGSRSSSSSAWNEWPGWTRTAARPERWWV